MSIPKRSRQNSPTLGESAEARGGQGSDTAQSSDWMAERITPAQADTAPQGVPLSTGKSKAAGRAQAVESRRGSHR